MAQNVIYVHFNDHFPSCEDISRIVQERAGIRVDWEFAEGYSLVLRPGEEISALIDFVPSENRVRVEVGMPPTHFEWIVVGSLQQLGGTPSRQVPGLAAKKLDDTTWWERLQLGERLRRQ
ncbi:MAG: hypothetical protein H6710_16620 [Myxococcales bacterium]|nr:hypothetical protein [Myxococcales bacterium]